MVAVLWRCRCARVLLGCCSTGVLGAVGSGRLWLHGCCGRCACCAGGPGCAVGGGLPACAACGPRVFRAPASLAAREIATRELRSEWSISKPARALRSLRRPPHLWGLVCWRVAGSSPRCPARPCRHLIDFARNSPAISSNFEFVSLELQRFRVVSKNDRVKLRAKFGWRWCRRSPRVPQPGSVDQVARWCETPVAFARWCLCGSDTAIAFAGKK